MTFLSLLLLAFSPTVTQVGADSWHDREAATRSLRSVGWLAIPALRVGLRSTDPEIVHRSRQLLDRYPPASDLPILWLVFRPGPWVSGCESADLRPTDVDACLRRWRLYAPHPAEPWPASIGWSEPEQVRASLNFARMRARQPGLSWASVPWAACLEPEK